MITYLHECLKLTVEEQKGVRESLHMRTFSITTYGKSLEDYPTRLPACPVSLDMVKSMISWSYFSVMGVR